MLARVDRSTYPRTCPIKSEIDTETTELLVEPDRAQRDGASQLIASCSALGQASVSTAFLSILTNWLPSVLRSCGEPRASPEPRDGL